MAAPHRAAERPPQPLTALPGPRAAAPLAQIEAVISELDAKKNATLQVLRLDHNRGLGAEGVALLGESLAAGGGFDQALPVAQPAGGGVLPTATVVAMPVGGEAG